jgi:hypothetical protein
VGHNGHSSLDHLLIVVSHLVNDTVNLVKENIRSTHSKQYRCKSRSTMVADPIPAKMRMAAALIMQKDQECVLHLPLTMAFESEKLATSLAVAQYP